MSGKEELTSLFGDSGSNTGSSFKDAGSDENGIPEGVKKLASPGRAKLKPRIVHTHVGVKMYYSEISDENESYNSRYDLAETVFKHANGNYDEVEGWGEYDPIDVIDLTVYLLDELDRAGEMRGMELARYLEEFIEQDGRPEYMEDFEL